MSPVDGYTLFGNTREQENELINILSESALFLDLYPEEKQILIRYLVSSYFN